MKFNSRNLTDSSLTPEEIQARQAALLKSETEIAEIAIISQEIGNKATNINRKAQSYRELESYLQKVETIPYQVVIKMAENNLYTLLLKYISKVIPVQRSSIAVNLLRSELSCGAFISKIQEFGELNYSVTEAIIKHKKAWIIFNYPESFPNFLFNQANFELMMKYGNAEIAFQNISKFKELKLKSIIAKTFIIKGQEDALIDNWHFFIAFKSQADAIQFIKNNSK